MPRPLPWLWRSVARSCLAATLLIFAGAASALPLIGDETILDLTSEPALEALGASLNGGGAPLGSVALPITGGDVEIPLLTGTVEHDGSLLTLSSALGSLGFQDLVIDLTASLVRADLIFAANFAVFEVRSCLLSTAADPCIDDDGSLLVNGFGLDWTDAAATLVNDIIFGGVQNLRGGDQFAVADLDLRFGSVPEPAGALLAVSALGVLGLLARRPRTSR